MRKHFEKNLELFRVHNPKGAALLALDVQKKDPQGDWKCTFSLDGIEIVCLYGLEGSFAALKSWLEKDSTRKLILLEDDLGIILHFLESGDAACLLTHPQVHIFYLEDSEDGLEVLQSIAWQAYGKKMLIASSPYKKCEVFSEIKARLQYETSDIHIILDEYMAYGVSFFRNFWKNLSFIAGSYKGNKLEKKFKNIPAIVVAAGPSLKPHLDVLQGLRDKALIFSGGSSVNALIGAGIQPHFGAGIDPNPLQYIRFRDALAFQLPFFYRARLLNESLKTIEGPRLYLKGGDGYNITDWFEEKLRIPGTIIGGGHSVANFIIEIAETLGCNPIILVGYDLAFGKQDERYAPGVESAALAAQAEDEPVLWKDIDGNPIKTAWKWILEAKWIEDFAKEHPKVQFINATMGGLGIEGLTRMPLEDVESKYLGKQYDLDGMVHTQIEEAGTIAQDTAKIRKLAHEMYESLERVKSYLGTKDLLLEAELKQEIGYKYVLEVFERMRMKLEYYRLRFGADPQKEQEERILFLKDVATVNQLLIVEQFGR